MLRGDVDNDSRVWFVMGICNNTASQIRDPNHMSDPQVSQFNQRKVEDGRNRTRGNLRFKKSYTTFFCLIQGLKNKVCDGEVYFTSLRQNSSKSLGGNRRVRTRGSPPITQNQNSERIHGFAYTCQKCRA